MHTFHLLVQELNDSNNSNGYDDSWVDKIESFIQFFHGPDFDKTLSMIRDGKLLRLKRIAKSDKVNVSHSEEANTIFTTLCPLLEYIVDSQFYLPPSSSSSTQGTMHQTLDLIKTATRRNKKALNFMKFMALLVHAYLDSILTKDTSSHTSQVFCTSRPSERNEPCNNVSGIRTVLPQVTRITETLQDSLLTLGLNTDTIMVQKTITHLCEVYWTSNFRDRQVVTTQLLPFFFMKSLSLLSTTDTRSATTRRPMMKSFDATKADLKRIWTFREALYCFDYESMTRDNALNTTTTTATTTHDNKDTKDPPHVLHQMDLLIVRTVSNPLFCKTVEGRKIISFCFTLHESIAMKLHHAIKGQILYLRGTTATDKISLEYYGDIYLRAWKLSHPDLHQDDVDSIDVSSPHDLSSIHTFIEDEILADLVLTSLHVASPIMAKNIRLLLEPFFTEKKDKYLVNLLYRLYGPILWRSLSAANPNVRLLATMILQKTFPLEDSIELMSRDMAKNNKQEVVNKTVTMLQQLLNDIYPRIRVAAADATVRILGEFWDAIPPRHIRTLLQIIITKHANDASSSLVRANSLHVITLLLQSSDASHAVLRQLLPSLGNLIHDKVERVRAKAVQLLTTIKTIQDIKYYHVVPSDHITCQLAEEGKTVSRAITKLLLNSYFPKDAKGSVQIERTLMFLSSNYEAARVFYANLKFSYSTNVICKLIAMLLKVLKLAVDRHRGILASGEDETSSGGSLMDQDAEESDDDSEDGEESNISSKVSGAAHNIIATNTSLMASVAEIIEILYDSLDSLSNSCESYLQSSTLDVDLPSIVDHFGAMWIKYVQLKGRTREASNSQRITISILRFYSNMSNDQVIAISSQQLAKVLSVDLDAHDSNKTTMLALPYVNLLCLCGKHRPIAQLLSRSIRTVVHEFLHFRGKEARVDGSLYIAPTDGSAISDKSVHATNKWQTSIDADPAFSNSHVFENRPGVALNIFSEMLNGSDTHSRAAREVLLNCKDSCELLDESFQSFGDVSTSIEHWSLPKGRMYLMLCEVSLRYFIHKIAGDKLVYDLSRLFNVVSILSPVLTKICSSNSAGACSENSPMSPFQVLNLSNISMDSSTRISLSSTSLSTANFLKRKFSDIEADGFDRVTGIAYIYSFLVLLLSIVTDYRAIGGRISDESLALWKTQIDCIFSLDSGDDVIWGNKVKNVLFPVLIGRVFPLNYVHAT